MSQYANELSCQYCGKTHGASQWPTNGDLVPFYYQLEKGRYTLAVTCPHCGKEWYVVWDDNPGPMKPLQF